MSSLRKRVHSFAKKASSVEHSNEVVHAVTRSEIAELVLDEKKHFKRFNFETSFFSVESRSHD